ncbi:MAG: 16S rRNA (cytosine(967)-C(5))-methyltransferase RsmB [Halieaceae bacterium]|nr:16S rRNA (cytosine(967)-C(5))-methyltransferase RsmB [Halieaceae bacterium]
MAARRQRDCRAAAATALARVIDGGEALDIPLAEALEQVEARDSGLLQQLCYGTLRHYYRLDGILGRFLDKPLKRRDTDIRMLLLIGLHQLLDLRIPDHAAISTCVEACRSLGKPWATRLVNGILRRSLREADGLTDGLTESQLLGHPDWLLSSFKESWPQHWQQLVAANNQHPPMCLRVNRQHGNRADYLERLEAAGIEAGVCELVADGIRLAQAVDVNSLPGFADGDVSVQDEAAQLAAELLDAQAGERVLDACAAPGGKACHVLERQPQLEELVAMDRDPARLARVEDNLARLQLSAALLCADAAAPPEELTPGSFDRILVDAPCSGSGVIRRHPDIKLLRRPQDLAGLADQQLEILNGLWPLLKPGGRLLYVTCSVLPAENADVVARFLATHDDADSRSIEADWGETSGDGRQLLTTVAGWDGLYYAMLEKAH